MTEFDALWAILLIAPAVTAAYTYLGYPLLLAALGRIRPAPSIPDAEPGRWPSVSVSLPVHNEETIIRKTLETLLDLDYPRDRMQILVVSDASTDDTEAIVHEFDDDRIELLSLSERGGKTAAENAAIPHLRGEIVVNTDASTRIPRDSLKALIRPFSDDNIGVASGRDLGVPASSEAPLQETSYTDYEMRLRSMETGVGSIVGASGCFYAIRRELHAAEEIPPGLSRDFAAPLSAKEAGYRSVTVDQATAMVPVTSSLRQEFRRKARTILRGLRTLFYKRHLLNPFEHGKFAFMLCSHKLCRWLVPILAVPALCSLGVLSLRYPLARWVMAVAIGTIGVGTWAIWRDDSTRLSRPLATVGFVVAANAAVVLAWLSWLRGDQSAVWTPTERSG